jgi:hypothetical protein
VKFHNTRSKSKKPMLLDHPTISERYFFPHTGSLPANKTFWVESTAGRLACYYHQPFPRDKTRTVVHFHGNGEVVSDYLPWFAEALSSLGVNVFFAEYRGYGRSEGRPALTGMLDDVSAIFDAIGLPQEQLIVFGRSVGSIYALEFIRRYPSVWGLILESGIADPLERVLIRVDPSEIDATDESVKNEALKYLDHKAKLAPFPGRLLIMHARFDHLIDPSHAERNHRWAEKAKSRLVIFPRGDHNSIFPENQKAYLNELETFFGQ